MMSIHTPVTPHEERLFTAFDEYSSLRLLAENVMSDPSATKAERVAVHQRAIEAYKRVAAILSEPTPADLADESAKLTCEGFLLLALVTGFAGLFLPDLEEHFWPLAVTFVAVAALGGWSVHYLGRLGQHLGRRM